MRFLTWLLTYAVGLAVAAWLLDGIWFDGARNGGLDLRESWLDLLLVAFILGVISTFVEPVIKLLSLPFIILTLGLLLLVINAVTLLITAWLADAFDLGFHVDGFWYALLGSIVVTVVGWGVRILLPDFD
jgi:putative membrane protein